MAQVTGALRRASAVFVLAFICLLLAQSAAWAAVAAATVRIHYNRTDGTAATWQLYHWYGSLFPSPTWVPAQPIDGSDAFGVYYDVPVKTTDSGLNWILHDSAGNQKNCPDDRFFAFPVDIATVGVDIWQLQDDCTIYTSQPAIKVGDVAKAKAYFVTRDTIAWPGAGSGNSYKFFYSPTGGITSGVDGVAGGQSIALTHSGTVGAAIVARFPQLAGAGALAIGSADLAKVPALLRGQMVVAKYDGSQLIDATSLQIPGVLDQLYAYSGVLGATKSRDGQWGNGVQPAHGGDDDASPAFRVWAPTAQSVRVMVFDGPSGAASSVLPMTFNAATGVWKARARADWFERGHPTYYLYEVTVFVRSTGRVEINLVTDPYSLGLAVNGSRSLVVDLDAPHTQPHGWQHPRPPRLAAPEDIVLYELHTRDFSANDASVPAADRGKFRAFTFSNTHGMAHLRSLQQAGLTHIHLLPSFDISSVPEDGCVTPAVPAAAPDATAQQAAIAAVKDSDCFNWGYDPFHYTVPDGSYASNPNGVARIVEFRDMVRSLHANGLRVVMDVVYNHTTAGGQNANSVLDRIVPGYYHRLNGVGDIETSTCCANTASENAMMGKLLVDSVLTWARDYDVDGFRFDLMAFHPLPLMRKLKAELAKIDPAIYIYGEGWNFGEVANNARFVQTSQLNIAGSGIGAFSDRMRDAVRGGGPFDGGDSLIKNQGFINGLWTHPNALAGGPFDWQRDLLNQYADWIRLGLAGTLKDYVFTDKDGNTRKGSELDYNGQPAGYTADPQEVINYVSSHDNQTLFDNDQFKLPTSDTGADRVRVNNLGIATVLLSQGVPFFHAGDDLLRSKSLDRDSYNSGDWFNKLDLSYASNNWGVGLPPEFTGNAGNWSVMAPLLANPNLSVGPAEIAAAHAYFLDLLRIRNSLPLLRLRSGADVMSKLKFYNVGPNQIPGFIVMAISDPSATVDWRHRSIVALINADVNAHSFAIPGYVGHKLWLHPVQQASSADPIVKSSSFSAASGTFTVPGRTTAVFVEYR